MLKDSILKDSILNVIINHELFKFITTYVEDTDNYNFLTLDEKVIAGQDGTIIKVNE